MFSFGEPLNVHLLQDDCKSKFCVLYTILFYSSTTLLMARTANFAFMFSVACSTLWPPQLLAQWHIKFNPPFCLHTASYNRFTAVLSSAVLGCMKRVSNSNYHKPFSLLTVRVNQILLFVTDMLVLCIWFPVMFSWTLNSIQFIFIVPNHNKCHLKALQWYSPIQAN